MRQRRRPNTDFWEPPSDSTFRGRHERDYPVRGRCTVGDSPFAVRRESLLQSRGPVATENHRRPHSVVSERVASSEIEHRLSDSSSTAPSRVPFVSSQSPFAETRDAVTRRPDRVFSLGPTDASSRVRPGIGGSCVTVTDPVAIHPMMTYRVTHSHSAIILKTQLLFSGRKSFWNPVFES